MWKELQKHWSVKCSDSLSLEQIKKLGIEIELESPPQLGGCFLHFFLPFYFKISSKLEYKSWLLKVCSNRITNIKIWIGKGKGAFLQYRAVEFLTRAITGLWVSYSTINVIKQWNTEFFTSAFFPQLLLCITFCLFSVLLPQVGKGSFPPVLKCFLSYILKCSSLWRARNIMMC